MERLLGTSENGRESGSSRQHLSYSHMPAALYAIGDVHGCYAELRALEAQIIADGAKVDGEKLIVMLGDYVDRGPDSAGVIEHLVRRPPDGFGRICLMGNHEVMMRDFIARPNASASWLENGGADTLQSYGISRDAFVATRSSQRDNLLQAHIPSEHIDFLESLSWTLSMPNWLFVHAGIKPGVPVESQRPEDLFWIRDDFYRAVDSLDPKSVGQKVVHGHTPGPEPVITPGRIGLDTGAYATGKLTALRLTPTDEPKLFHTSARH